MLRSGAGARQTTMTERSITVLAILAPTGALKTAAMEETVLKLWLTNFCLIRVNMHFVVSVYISFTNKKGNTQGVSYKL